MKLEVKLKHVKGKRCSLLTIEDPTFRNEIATPLSYKNHNSRVSLVHFLLTFHL